MAAFSRLIWADPVTDLAVAVNGGLIEISLPDGWSGRCLPREVADLGAQFAAALAEATALTKRWNTETRSYDDKVAV